jgi:hypothetical protein
MEGDPLTPELPSTEGMSRLNQDDANLPNIPTISLSYKDAEEFMKYETIFSIKNFPREIFSIKNFPREIFSIKKFPRELNFTYILWITFWGKFHFIEMCTIFLDINVCLENNFQEFYFTD